MVNSLLQKFRKKSLYWLSIKVFNNFSGQACVNAWNCICERSILMNSNVIYAKGREKWRKRLILSSSLLYLSFILAGTYVCIYLFLLDFSSNFMFIFQLLNYLNTWFYIFSGFTKMECTRGKSRILWILIWRIWIWVTMLSTGLTTNIPGKSKSRSCNRSKTLFKSLLFGYLEKWVGFYLGQSTSSFFFGTNQPYSYS